MNNKVIFADEKFDSPFFLAASPLTATTVIKNLNKGDKWNFDIKHLVEKLQFFLDFNFDNAVKLGGAVLKTVYYPKNSEYCEEDKPKTRVWLNKNNLYNLGYTPAEMIDIKSLKKFLNMLPRDFPIGKLILSFGIKSCNLKLWMDLFEELTDKIFFNCKLIEINARHTLREINNLYMGEKDIDEYAINPMGAGIWNIVFEWFTLLNNLAIVKNKKLLIKLPFRSDLLILCSFINKIIVENRNAGISGGIRGITLINSIKTPFIDPSKHKEFGMLMASEKIKFQQLSGEYLSGIRNWAIKIVHNRFNENKENIWICASGGLMTSNDIFQSELFGAKIFQLCSIALIEGIDGIKKVIDGYYENRKEWEQNVKKFKFVTLLEKSMLDLRKVSWDKKTCKRCMKCLKTFYCDAFLNRYLIYKKYKFIKLNGEGYYIPKNFYPKINLDYCTGCGLCIQICKFGALKFKN